MIELALTGSVVVLILMFIAWFCYLMSGNASVIDLFWPLGFLLLFVVYALLGGCQSLPRVIVLIIGAVWGFRLFFYLLFTRVIKGHHDPRYSELSREWKIKKSLGFLANYCFQGLLLLVISTPFLVMFSSEMHQGWLFYCGSVLAVLSIINEAVADAQLSSFKAAASDSQEQVCNIGLWRYSRHPNYFFDWLFWVGVTLISLPGQFGWLSIISPLLLLFIFLGLTINITEQHSLIKKREAYSLYQRTTPKFFPWRSRSDRCK